jgi:oxygen-independent coproporphyrinogen-3 oxidase
MDLSHRAGLYVHVPFCRSKCPYCSFSSAVPQPGDIRDYVEALRRQMRQMAARPEIEGLTFATVFFGGGTPSLLPPEVLSLLLADCRALFSFGIEQTEISIEVNPATIDAAGLQQLRRAGFNRVSLGIQSLDDRDLASLGRIHTAAEALATISAARHAGFDNLSCDLMYGLPGQTAQSWQRILERMLAVTPEHCSLYELTVEEGTPLSRQVEQGQWFLPPEEEVLAMMATTANMVSCAGLVRYEISNYAAPGRECQHNLNYWHNGCYLGFGPAAVSAFGGRRLTAVPVLRAYCQRLTTGQPVWDEIEQLPPEAALRETVIMGLRMLSGVSVTGLRERFDLDLVSYYGATLDLLIGQGLLVLAGDRLFLAPKGLPLANQVMARLV